MNGIAFCIDDDISSLMIIEEYCKSIELESFCFTNATDALERYKYIEPDIIITDFNMNKMNGIEFCQNIRKKDIDIPIIMFTSQESEEKLKIQALEAGVSEFLYKPFNIHEFKIRVKNLVKLRKYALEKNNRVLELKNEVDKAVFEIREKQMETLKVLIEVSRQKDNESAEHVIRVGKISKILASLLGLSQEQCNTLYYASQLHDVGKVAIPDDVLYKKDKLDHDEYEKIKEHSEKGYRILKGNKSDYLKMGAEIALTHHEKYDGTGYPRGLKGEEISIFGRIVAVADVFDALIMKRVYKKSWQLKEVLEYMNSMKGKQFDPIIIDILLANLDEIQELYY